MNYQEAERYINDIPKFSKEKSADNTRAILAYFGHPELSFEYIHVAGTNGKGSVCAYLDSMLRAAGVKTGLFTSPHLITTTERMKINGSDISESAFVSVFNELYAVVKSRMAEGYPHPTYFEWLYLMAMIWFGRNDIEYGVIETGLGGRLDATNCVEKPAITVITSISYDHMAILGETLTEIAGEKAGIIKRSVPLIVDASENEAVEVIKRQAEKMDVSAIFVNPSQIKKVLNNGKSIDFCLEAGYDEKYSIHLNTAASYQMINSSLAWMAVKQLQQQDARLKSVSDSIFLEGLNSMHWPGRMEEILPGIYIDGAHNLGGVIRLKETIETGFNNYKIFLVFAVANDKSYEEMIHILCSLPQLQYVMITEIDNSRRTDLNKLAEIFQGCWHGKIETSYNIHEAIIKGKAEAHQASNSILLCAGSLYLAGSVMEAVASSVTGG